MMKKLSHIIPATTDDAKVITRSLFIDTANAAAINHLPSHGLSFPNLHKTL